MVQEVLMHPRGRYAPFSASTIPIQRLLGLPMDEGFETDAKHFSWIQPSRNPTRCSRNDARGERCAERQAERLRKGVFNLWRASSFTSIQVLAPAAHGATGGGVAGVHRDRTRTCAAQAAKPASRTIKRAKLIMMMCPVPLDGALR